jgi:hypothetical protein
MFWRIIERVQIWSAHAGESGERKKITGEWVRTVRTVVLPYALLYVEKIQGDVGHEEERRMKLLVELLAQIRTLG